MRRSEGDPAQLLVVEEFQSAGKMLNAFSGLPNRPAVSKVLNQPATVAEQFGPTR